MIWLTMVNHHDGVNSGDLVKKHDMVRHILTNLVNKQVVNKHHEPWLTWLITPICLVFGSTTLVKNVTPRVNKGLYCLLLFWLNRDW